MSDTAEASLATLDLAVAGSRERERDHRWLALAVIGVAQLMIVFDASILNIALPSTQRALHISDAHRQWVLTAYALPFGGLLLLGGRVADYLGRKRAFVIGLLGFAAASALGGAAQSGSWLFSARAAQGAFAAVLAPAALALIATTFTEERERAKAFGVYGAISGAAGAIGLIAGGALTEYLSWRSTMLVNVPIAIAVALASIPLLRDSRRDGNRRLDVAGALLATAGLALLVYGCSEAATRGWSDGITVSLLCAAGALLVGFVGWETRAANPMLPMRIVLNRSRGGAYAAFLLIMLPLFATYLCLGYFFQTVLGYSPLKAGLAFLPLPLGVIVSSTIASRLLPRFGPRLVACVGLSLSGVGLLWLTQLEPTSSYVAHVAPAVAVMALGLGHMLLALSSTALLGVREQDSGVASALFNAMQQVGNALGVAALNTVATTATASYARSHGGLTATAMVHGFTTVFATSVGILAAALVVVLALVRGSPSHPRESSHE